MADFLAALFGMELSGAASFAFTLVAVLAAVALLFLLVRSMRGQRFAMRKSGAVRLTVTETARIDDRRRLVLVRRDDVEHLILVGGTQDLVVEPNIRCSAGTSPNLKTKTEPVETTAERNDR